jgi:multimeric flavodoxin WrbA
MKITNVIGSPRSTGNSATIARVLLDSLQTSGAEVRTVELNKLNYRGCQGCMACKTSSDQCVVKDDLSEVLEEIRVSDVVLIASPVYFGDITAQMKGLIDRCYSYFSPDYKTNPHPSRLAAGKKLIFILAQGNPDQNAFEDIVTKYTRIFGRLGFTDVYPIRALGVGPESDVRTQETVLQSINDAVHKIAAGA